jgi:hypothetical protein
MQITLKTKNSPSIIAFGILIYVGFALANGFDWSFAKTMEIGEKGVKLDDPVLSFAFYVLAIGSTYLLSSDWKHRLIYARYCNPLPGSRVFTELIDRDNRISRKDLISQHGVLPTDPKAQNNLWYTIYRTKQSDPVIHNSHGRWLLFRDLFAIAIVLSIPSSIFTFCHSGVKMGLLYSALYILLVAALWACARNTGERFTCNVLAR